MIPARLASGAGLLALGLAVTAWVPLTAQGGPAASPAQETPGTTPGSTDPTSTPTATVSAAAHDPWIVTYGQDGLDPVILAIPEGASVRWVNQADVTHNTSHLPELGQPVLWASDLPAGGGAFTHTFEAVGTYGYVDALFPDDLDFQGRIIVQRDEPTSTPMTPTAGPSPTMGPTATREPSSTPPPTPTRPPPTAVPVSVRGRLVWYEDPTRPCGVDIRVYLCDQPGRSVLVRSDGRLGPLLGYDVLLQGVMVDCPAIGGSYLWVSQAQPLPGGCEGPTATATPSPTPRPPFDPTTNLARGRPVVAKRPVVAGFEASRATDGDRATAWYSPEPVSWLYVDLGAPTTFNQVRLRWSSPHAVRYGLYVWQDGAWQGRLMADAATGGDDLRNMAYVETRYLLVYLIRSSSPSGGYALGELELYSDGRPNWALGQPVVVSSEQSSYEGMYATDGTLGAWWVSQPGDEHPWLAVYLPESVPLVEFKLYWTTRYPRLYSLVFFERGRASFSANLRPDRDGLHHVRGQVPVRADTLMVYAHQNAPEGMVGLQEIELYAPGPHLEVLSTVRQDAGRLRPWSAPPMPLEMRPLTEGLRVERSDLDIAEITRALGAARHP